MTVPKKTSKPAEVIRFKSAMASRDLTPARLAAFPEMRGFNNRRIANVMAATDRTWPIRAAINAALGIEIFSKPSLSTKTKAPPPPPE